jgi:hypothetical protein
MLVGFCGPLVEFMVGRQICQEAWRVLSETCGYHQESTAEVAVTAWERLILTTRRERHADEMHVYERHAHGMDAYARHAIRDTPMGDPRERLIHSIHVLEALTTPAEKE